MTRWLFRLAFPALGLLVLLLIVFGVQAPEDGAETATMEKKSSVIPSFEAVVPAPVPAEGPDIVFKWQDADGSWNYADQPPPEGQWNTMSIDPGNKPEQETSESQTPAENDLKSPYRAPFSLNPAFPEAGS